MFSHLGRDLHENILVSSGHAGLRISDMQMGHGPTRFMNCKSLLNKLLQCNGRVNMARNARILLQVITQTDLREGCTCAILYVTNPVFPIDIGRLDRVFLL